MAERMLVFVGSYADGSGSGVYVYEFDERNESLTLTDEVSGLRNPTFVNLDAAGRRLYSIVEGTNEAGGKTGEAAAFAVDPAAGKLELLNRSFTVDAPTCHIQRDSGSSHIVVASYHGGRIALVALTADGRIGEQLDVQQHEGHGPNAERQEKPHPHSAFFSPDERYLFVPDLGIDRIRAYTIDKERGKLQFHGETASRPGAGPRHMTFHPNGKIAFVINELDSSITSYHYDAEQGALQAIATVPTLPSGFAGENTCAEIAVSEDGNYLYGSNRGHDSIAVYAIDAAAGTLSLVEHVSVEGEHPRHFALTPGGRYLIAANRDTNNLVLFRVDKASGKLTPTGKTVEVAKPVCVKPAYFTV